MNIGANRRCRPRLWKLMLFLPLLGFAAYFASDVVFDALNVDDFKIFGWPDDDVIVVEKTVQAHADRFFRADLPLADFPGLLNASREVSCPLVSTKQGLSRACLHSWLPVALPRVNLGGEAASPAHPSPDPL